MNDLRFTCAKAGEHWCHLPHGSYRVGRVDFPTGDHDWKLTFRLGSATSEDLGAFRTCGEAKAAAGAREVTRAETDVDTPRFDAHMKDLYRLSEEIFAVCERLPAERVVEVFAMSAMVIWHGSRPGREAAERGPASG